MKKLVLAILICFVCFSINAQSHLTFKGLPILGDANEFALKLKDKGYTIVDSSDNFNFLTGTFAGHENVTIAVVGTPKTNTVYKVCVIFEKETDSFSKLETQYKSLLNSYIDKYGKPEKSYDFFMSPYYKGDGYELQAVKKDKCRYISFFSVENGHLIIEIAKTQNVMVTYEDLDGASLCSKEKELIINDDI